MNDRVAVIDVSAVLRRRYAQARIEMLARRQRWLRAETIARKRGLRLAGRIRLGRMRLWQAFVGLDV